MRVRGFAHTLTTLRPHLDKIVLTGGWAWYLYRKYRTGATGLEGEFTLDVDFAVPRILTPPELRLDHLLDGAAFTREMEGDDRPPVTRHYWPSVDAPEAVVEFLTPARSSGDVPTLEVGGIVAQQLRFVDLMLDDPLRIQVDEQEGPSRFVGPVQVPRIGQFVLHKGLTFPRRRRSPKKYKDLFYIFDLVDESRELLPEIHEDLVRVAMVRGTAWLDSAADQLADACGQAEADAVGRIIDQIPLEGRPSRRYVAETMTSFVNMLRAAKG